MEILRLGPERPTDPDEAPHALLEGVSSGPRPNGKQGPLAGRAGLAAGKQRLAGRELRGRCRVGGLGPQTVLKP